MLVVGPIPAVLICPNPPVGTPVALLVCVAAAFVDTGAGISARLNTFANSMRMFNSYRSLKRMALPIPRFSLGRRLVQ